MMQHTDCVSGRADACAPRKGLVAARDRSRLPEGMTASCADGRWWGHFTLYGAHRAPGLGALAAHAFDADPCRFHPAGGALFFSRAAR